MTNGHHPFVNTEVALRVVGPVPEICHESVSTFVQGYRMPEVLHMRLRWKSSRDQANGAHSVPCHPFQHYEAIRIGRNTPDAQHLDLNINGKCLSESRTLLPPDFVGTRVAML
jgi:hypothetical protein